MSTVKRLFLYVVSLVALGIFSEGVKRLFVLVFDLFNSGRDFAATDLSLGLAMVIIGGVLWWVFWRIVQGTTVGQPAEIGSGVRKLYLNFILVFTSISAVVGFAGFFDWVIGGTPYTAFPSEYLAGLIVSAAFWWYHSRVEDAEGQPSYVAKLLRRWYVYILSGFGLVVLSVNVIQVVNSSVSYLISSSDFIFRNGLWHGVLSEELTWAVAGGLTWGHFWFRMAKGDYESVLRQVYLYLLTIAGSAVTVLAAFSTLIYNLLRLAFDSTVTADFTFLGWTVPAILVGMQVWVFHRKTVEEESEHLTLNRQSPQRLYRYLMSFIGLGGMLAGLTYLFSLLFYLLFSAISSVTIYAAGWWGNQISIALALLVVGAPVWLYFWRGILRVTGEGDVGERSARSRRIYVYLMLGISIIAAVTTLVICVYQIINAILQSDFGQDVYSNLVWSLSVLLTAIPVLIYHWKLLREDQELGAEKAVAVRRKRVNVVFTAGMEELVARIEQQLGYRVRKLNYTGEMTGEPPVVSDEDLEHLVTRISEADGDGAIIDLTGDKLKLLTFEDA